MMTVRNVLHDINERERVLNMIEKMKHAELDPGVSEDKIQRIKQEIEDLYALNINNPEFQMNAMTQLRDIRRTMENIVKYAYNALFGEDKDEIQ